MEGNEEKNKSGHGGRRAGAGRKRDGHGKYFGFNSTKEVEKILNELSGSKTDFINKAVLFYFNEMQKK